MSNIYLGIDASLTNTGLVVLDDNDNIEVKNIKTKPNKFESSIGRCSHIADKIIEFAKIHKPELIVIEDYFSGRQAGTVIKLAELGTMIRYKLLTNGFKYLTVAPTQLKKFCSGKGNCAKELILKEVFRKWQFDTSDNNTADAYVLAKMSKALHNELNNIEQDLLKYEQEVINKILESRSVVDNLK